MICPDELGRKGGGKEGHSKTLRALMKKGVGFPFCKLRVHWPASLCKWTLKNWSKQLYSLCILCLALYCVLGEDFKKRNAWWFYISYFVGLLCELPE